MTLQAIADSNVSESYDINKTWNWTGWVGPPRLCVLAYSEYWLESETRIWLCDSTQFLLLSDICSPSVVRIVSSFILSSLFSSWPHPFSLLTHGTTGRESWWANLYVSQAPLGCLVVETDGWATLGWLWLHQMVISTSGKSIRLTHEKND